MQKFLKIAEQQVQWVALGIGVLYLALMAWSYGYQSDINVTLGTQKNVQPGEIDATIVKGPITQLDNGINNSAPITITPKNVVALWTKNVSDPSDVHEYARVWTGDPTNLPGSGGGGGLEEHFAIKPLEKAPEPPAAYPVAVAAYRTLAQNPDPNFNPAANPAGAAVPMINKDIDAVSVKFKVDMKQLAKAFSDAFPTGGAMPLPGELYQTLYLRVTLFRSEQNATGEWNPPTEVPSLSINPLPPFPPDSPDDQTATAYQYWARDNQELIVHPPFYTVAPGAEPWVEPGAANGVGAPGGENVGPGLPGGGNAGPLSGTRPTPPVPGGFRPLPGGAGTSSGAVYPGSRTPTYQPPTFGQPNPLPADTTPLQPGFFNPLTKNTDDFIIAHDDTVKPESTYRYYVQYKLYNPLFHANRLGKGPVLNQFALISPGPTDSKSQPTEKITIPSRTQLFVKSIRGGESKAETHFSVFVWTPNAKETEIVAYPGDLVTPTPWTLVDVRKDPVSLDWYVLLVDENGRLERRDLRKDQADPHQKEYHDRAAAAAGAAAAGNGGAPGGPGGFAPGVFPQQ